MRHCLLWLSPGHPWRPEAAEEQIDHSALFGPVVTVHIVSLSGIIRNLLNIFSCIHTLCINNNRSHVKASVAHATRKTLSATCNANPSIPARPSASCAAKRALSPYFVGPQESCIADLYDVQCPTRTGGRPRTAFAEKHGHTQPSAQAPCLKRHLRHACKG